MSTVIQGTTYWADWPFARDATFDVQAKSSIAWISADGEIVPAGQSRVVGTGTIALLRATVPDITLPTTTAGLDSQTARWTVTLHRTGKDQVVATLLDDFTLPVSFEPSATWAQISIHKKGKQPLRDTSVYTKLETDYQISLMGGTLNDAGSAVKGRTRLSYAPTSATSPIAVGLNDPRLSYAQPGAIFVFDGDSITRGLNLVFGTEDWPSKAMLEPWFSLAGGTKHNTAISGSVTSDIIARYPANDRQYSPSVTGLPGYFFSMSGVNDAQAGDSAATIFANITTLRNLALADGYTVFICTPTPNGNAAQSLRDTLQDLTELLRSSGWAIIDFNKALPDPTNTTMFQDLLHWTATGAAFAAKFAAQQVTRNSPAAGAALELTQRSLSKIGAIGINTAPANHVPLDILHLHADVGTSSIKMQAQTDGDQLVVEMRNGVGLGYLYLTNQVPNFDFQGSFGNALVLASNNELQLITGGEARFTLMSTGKVGIGAFGPVASGLPQPDKLLHLLGSLNALKIEAANDADPAWAQCQNGFGIGLFGVEGDTAGSTFTNSLAYAAFYVSGAGTPAALQLGTNGSAQLTILTDGSVGIGTTSPTNILDVKLADSVVNGEHVVVAIDNNSDTAGVRIGWRADGAAITGSSIRAINSTPLLLGTSSAPTAITILNSGKVGIGTTAPATSAVLELASTTGALLVPRMTTTQKNALTAVNGMLVYDSTLNKFHGYENGAWTALI